MTTLKQTIINLIDDSNYNEAATKFLEATNTKLKIEFLKHGKHFADDKQTRDIYKCKLQRGKNSYSFNFGQSIAASCKEIIKPITETQKEIEVFAGFSYPAKKITCSTKFKIYKENNFELPIKEQKEIIKNLMLDFYKKIDEYNKKNKYNLFYKNETRDYISIEGTVLKAVERAKDKTESQYIEATEKTKPTNYDILACLQKYDVGSFEDFCDNYGYDNDSRKAEKTYKAVCKEFEGMERLFSPDELEILSEIN
jgi:hypothetical protein